MTTWLLFLLIGVGTGALYGALGMGVILVYRGSGVVNFALGAMAMYPAVVYAELRKSGDLLLPVVLVPNRVELGDAMSFWPAATLGLAMGLAVAAVSYLVIFRQLRFAPLLTLVVASVGLTIVLQGLAVKSFGTAAVRSPAVLPAGTIEVFGRLVPVDRFWLLALVFVAMIGLTIVYRKSRFGLATRAAVLSEKGVTLLGYSAGRLGLINWMLAAALVSVVGVLSSSLGAVDPFNFSFYVVPGLGAALAGRMKSLPIALFAGVAIGSFEALSVHLISSRQIPGFLQGGFSSLGPFLVIVAVLTIGGRSLPNRAAILEPRQVNAAMPTTSPWVWGVVSLMPALLIAFGDGPMRLAVLQTLFVVVLLLSIVILTGYLGQVSLAQLAFAGFSAFMLSRMDGIPFPVAPILAVGLTTITGTLIGVPALRIRGIQFAIVTFSAAFVFEQLLFRSPSFVGVGGLADVSPPELLGLDLDVFGSGQRGEFPRRAHGYLALLLTIGSAVFTARLRSSPVGRRFLAVRNNERAAAAAGINVARTKLAGAAFSSMIAGVAGTMFAYRSVTFNGSGLEASRGLELFALGYLGGIGSIAGAVIGGLLAPSGLVVVLLSSAEPSENQFLGTGVALLVVAIRFPGGLAALSRYRPSLSLAPDSTKRRSLVVRQEQ